MQVVKLLVGTYRVHVGVHPVARLYRIVGQGKPFPLSERMNHLCLCVSKIPDGECNGTFNTVKVIIDTQSFKDKQRRRDSPQAKFC
ncbi:unknown [Prevotella sp. CAG:1124]|nr:unknown [Prevotella sp. CAG:1124]